MTDKKRFAPPTSSASPFSVSLEEQPLDERQEDGRRPVVVASFSTPIEAELVKSRLEAEGIASDLLDVHTASIGGPLALAVGGVKLRVFEGEEERARDVIAGIGAVAIEEPEELEDDDEESLALSPVPPSPDALAQRALIASVIGAVVLPPLGLYSLWLLWRALKGEGELSRRGRVKAALALGFDLMTSLWLIPLLDLLP